MTTDSTPPWPLDRAESLREALSEQGMPPEEVDDLATTLLRLAAWQAPTPSLADTSRLQARLSASLPATAPVTSAKQPWRVWVARFVRVGARQPWLIHRSVWIASTLAIALVALYAALLHGPEGSGVLGIGLPLVAAAGAAFLYGHEADAGLEVTLAAPTSSRMILLTRTGLLIGYDAVLALGATALVAATHGGGLTAVAGLWLGPMALFSTGSLLVSLVLGPLVAVSGAAALWLAQTLDVSTLGSVRLSVSPLWQTTPLTLTLAVVLLGLALLYLPHRERLA